MRKLYILEHWVLTLLIAPFTSQAILYIWGKNPHQVVGLLEVYPITLIFSIIFSVPTLLIYSTCFYFLSKNKIDLRTSKFILIGISVIGVYITMAIVYGNTIQDIAIAYSFTALIIGLILKLKETNRKFLNDTVVV